MTGTTEDNGITTQSCARYPPITDSRFTIHHGLSLHNGQVKSWTRRRHLHNCGAEKNHRVCQRAIGHGVGNERVRLARHRVRDDGRDHIATHGRHHTRSVQPADESHIELRWKSPRRGEGEWDPLRGGHALRGRQSRERHHRECGIGGGARSDEGGRERVDRVQSQRGTVGVCGCDFAEGEALQRSVQSLGHENGTGNTEVRLGGDEACTAEVGGGADAFEHGGEGDEGHGVRVGEGVGAGLHGRGAGGGEGGLKVEYVLFFVVRDIFEIGIVVGAEAGIEEHLFWHSGDAALVEDIFKVLELVRCLVGVIIVLFGGGRGERD